MTSQKQALTDYKTTLHRRSFLQRSALLGTGLLSAGAPGLVWARAKPAAASWPKVTALADQYVNGRKVANVVSVMGFGAAKPQVVARGNLALGGKIPAGYDSLYRIYSMTKPITGMAAMMLIDEGKMGLDQPLADIMPEYRTMQVQKKYDGSIAADNLEPAKRSITIRHLLTHTAGLGYSVVQKGAIKRAYEQAGLIPGQMTKLPLLSPIFNAYKPAPSLEIFAKRLAEMPLVAQPGSRWLYSVSLDLMGRVIELVSGKEFGAFLQERLFDPIGMTSTYFTVPKSELGRLTSNYIMFNGAMVPVDIPEYSVYSDSPAFIFGGSGLVSSPRDYDRFLEMLAGRGVIDGKRVMSERAVMIGTSDILPKGADTKDTYIEGNGFGAGGRVGLGKLAGSYGWAGAAGTVGGVNMQNGLRSSLFTQYMPQETYPLGEEFINAVIADAAAMAMG